MATKEYGDAPSSRYVDRVEAAARLALEEYNRQADRDAQRRRFFGDDEAYPGLTDEDVAKVQRDSAAATLEVPTTMATSILADIPAGWAGMSAPSAGLDAAETVGKVQEKFTFMPRNEFSKNALASVGEAMETVLSPLTKANDAMLAAGQRNNMIPGVTIPLTFLTAAAEAIPGRKPARAAMNARRMAPDMPPEGFGGIGDVDVRQPQPMTGQYIKLADEFTPDDGYMSPRAREAYPESLTSDPAFEADMQRQGQGIAEVMGRRQRGSVEDTGGGKQVLAAQASRNAITNIVQNQPTPADMPPVNVSTPPKKESAMARRVGTTGQYRGAPRGIDKPQKLGKLRKDLLASLERGVLGRDWYDRSSQAAVDLTAGREGLRDRYVGAIATTSADTAVPGNAGFAIKGYNQMIAGDPIDTGRYPVRMSENINAINRGDNVMLTDKVGPFWEANRLDPMSQQTIRPTNDLWMARAFGYTQGNLKRADNIELNVRDRKRLETESLSAKERKKLEGDIAKRSEDEFIEWSSGLGEAQHRFMDDEINRIVDIANERKIGGFDDWTPERVQASIWVDTKARREGTSIQQAATDFATDLDARSINITSESAPANALNHMPGVYGDELLGQKAFDLQNQILTDQGGRNVLATHADALTRPQTSGVGVYQGENAPVAVNRILGGTETGAPTLDPSSRKVAETVGSVEGMLKGQETVGYNFLRKPQRVGDANAAVVAQVDDVVAFQNKLDEAFDGNVIATPSGEGIRILKIDGAPFDRGQRKALQDIVGEKPDWKLNSGDLLGNDEFSGYKPSKYLESIDEGVAARMDPATRYAAEAFEQLDDALVKEIPNAGARSEILQTTRKALSEGGIQRVRELVQQGILPAVVIGVLAGQAATGESSPPPGQGA